MAGHVITRGGFSVAESNDNITGSISGKLSFGGFLPKNFIRSYVFAEGGFGLSIWASDGDFGFEGDSIIFGGGGIDFIIRKYGSIYLEVGYLKYGAFIDGVSGVSVNVGTRVYNFR